MSIALFLEESLQAFGLEMIGVAVCTALLYGYVKIMSARKN